MRRTWVYDKDGTSIEVTDTMQPHFHYIQPDLADFVSTDGARISGKRQWRDHLKKTGSIEMGHSDMAASQREWAKKREKFQSRLKLDEKWVRPVEPPKGEIRSEERSRISREMANRLDGRPTPDRKMLIKLTLETAQRYRGR